MKTRTKVLLLSVCAIMLVAVTVVGTLAYLSDREEVVNTFTVGNVNIELDEAEVTPDGKPTGDDRVKENEYHLIPGQTYTKDPTLTVLKGSEESFVRMLVTINCKDELDAIFAPNGADLTTLFTGFDDTVWSYYGVTDNGDNTITYEFRYLKGTVTATDADVELEPLFTALVIPGEITGEQLATITDLNITVVGHAIQAIGFDSEDAAWVAFDAQMS